VGLFDMLGHILNVLHCIEDSFLRFFVHQVFELTFILCEMKREDIICGTTAWHLCILYLCVATMCTDLTPVYAQGMLQSGMA
jgi:hypothetical protein